VYFVGQNSNCNVIIAIVPNTFSNNGIYIDNLNYVLVVLCAARILDLSFFTK
jgi:hypothetical protein